MTLCPPLRRLAAQHARWLAELTRAAREDEDGRTARLLALWDGEILPHVRAEEDVLIPELAQRLSEADAVVVFTLGDHVVLKRLARALREAGPPARAATIAAFEAKLAEHGEFEERNLFPALQATLGCDRLARLGAELSSAAVGG